jgi:two-component system KDP operon response regulator KdpE
MPAEARKPEVVVIDDEIQIRRLLRVTLESDGFSVRDCDSGRVGLSEVAFRRPDVIVLDLGLPDMSGVDVLKRLREWTQVPILILSVRDHEDDKVAALDAGADDYLTKPFNGRELLARLRVMMRHSKPNDGISIVRLDSVEVDLARHVVTKAGAEVELTEKEFALLRLLVTHRGKVLTHRQVLREVWGPSAEEQTHYLRVYIDRLRRKLEDDPKRPKLLKTVPGAGYRIAGE